MRQQQQKIEALDTFMVVEAQSGAETLRIIPEERLDLIIADMRMPEMDGCTLMRNLRSKFYGVPVLAVSGSLGAEDLSGYGFDGFIDKPMGLDQLEALVEVTLQK
ncbi:MAG TPA: response regulator [Candidatus Latescibacteria bacterium]|nr:response regulator [Candidatus Latescibacterota bacterium]